MAEGGPGEEVIRRPRPDPAPGPPPPPDLAPGAKIGLPEAKVEREKAEVTPPTEEGGTTTTGRLPLLLAAVVLLAVGPAPRHPTTFPGEKGGEDPSQIRDRRRRLLTRVAELPRA